MNRSTYYKFLRHTPSKRFKENQILSVHILATFKEHKRRCGSIKLCRYLKRKGINTNPHRVLRLMKKMNLVPVTIKRYKPKTSNTKVVSKENILKQDFTATKPNEKWLTDITYIYTVKDGWTYLAVIEDLFSRKIVGYNFSLNIDSDLVTGALNNALFTRGKVDHLIIHSDLGSQYTSNDFEQMLKDYCIPHSYSAKGYPYDNSPMESFNSLIKKEEVYPTTTYKDFQTAKIALFEYIEGYYNTIRIHSSIDYYTPNEFEDAYYNPDRYVNFVH